MPRRPAPPTTAPQLLTLDEVAARLHVGRSTVQDLIAAGHLAVVDIRATGTRPRLRVTETELARFIASRAIAGGAA